MLAQPTVTCQNISVKHQQLLRDSAISPDVAQARGYKTITRSEELRRLGFSRAQSEGVPALLLPYTDATGATFYQIRPDKKRSDRPKYETPPTPNGGSPQYGLDVPSTVRERVLNSKEDIWVTEGARKSDALVSAGLCAVSLPGVWMFTRQGKPLPDFDVIPLSGREVTICYDSDCVTKENVYGAMRRLSNLLRKRGAIVSFCYLPDDGESKLGADDFLAQGKNADDLHTLVTHELRPVATAPVMALINTLNRQCLGIATFHPRRLELAGDGGHHEALKAVAALGEQRGLIDDEFKYWFGDAYPKLKLPHGEKLKTLETLLRNKGYARQIREWASVCKEFSGERSYFRHAADFWFLTEIARADEDIQDVLLAEHLNAPMNRERLRARKRELSGGSIGQDDPDGDGGSGGTTGAGGTGTASAVTVLFQKMREEDRNRLMELESGHDPAIVRQMLLAKFADALHWLVEEVADSIESDDYTEENDTYSLYKENTSSSSPTSILGENLATSKSPPAVILNPANQAISLSNDDDLDEETFTDELPLPERDPVPAATCIRCRQRQAEGTEQNPRWCRTCYEEDFRIMQEMKQPPPVVKREVRRHAHHH